MRWVVLVVGLMGCAKLPVQVACPAIEAPVMEPLTVEIFDTGTYPGPLGRTLRMKTADLDQIVANFYRLQGFIKVPIRLGHGEGIINPPHGVQPDDAGKGDPALGWVASVQRRGTKLIAQVVGMPRIVRELIARNRYRQVSIEWYVDWEETFDEYNLKTGARGYVLTAVTLLGADLPQVKTLRDLSAYL